MTNLVNLRRFLPNFSKSTDNSFLNFQQEVNKAFEQFYNALQSHDFFSDNRKNLTLCPPFDVVEDEKSYKIEIEMPGLDEKDITISLKNGVLCIQAKKETSRKDEGKEYVRREIGYGSYESYIDLPDYLDFDKAKASFKKGMLWVSFPKKRGADHAVKKITIEKGE